jgi:hypothetical protein
MLLPARRRFDFKIVDRGERAVTSSLERRIQDSIGGLFLGRAWHRGRERPPRVFKLHLNARHRLMRILDPFHFSEDGVQRGARRNDLSFSRGGDRWWPLKAVLSHEVMNFNESLLRYIMLAAQLELWPRAYANPLKQTRRESDGGADRAPVRPRPEPGSSRAGAARWLKRWKGQGQAAFPDQTQGHRPQSRSGPLAKGARVM